jgi:hypothetical protein
MVTGVALFFSASAVLAGVPCQKPWPDRLADRDDASAV